MHKTLRLVPFSICYRWTLQCAVAVGGITSRFYRKRFIGGYIRAQSLLLKES